MKKVFFETYGCQMNKADSDNLSLELTNNGYIITSSKNDADIIIINTCSVRKSAETRIWGRLGFYKELSRRKAFKLIVMGCMAERLKEDLIKSKFPVDIVVGTANKKKLISILKNENINTKTVLTGVDNFNDFFNYSAPSTENSLRSYVNISHGCNNYCSYCIVPFLRGSEKSRPHNEIIADINNLTEKGVKEVILLGQNVNSYGLDINDINFPKLLRLISKETSIENIKYISSHPKDFTDELIDEIITNNRVSKWVHLALQSGSDQILEKMNRKYTSDTYKKIVYKLKKNVPDLFLTTDIIVGFCGETNADYQLTKDLMIDIRFDDAYMYKYNVREGTTAAKNMIDDIPDNIKIDRLTEIINIQNNIGYENKQKRIGDVYLSIPENNTTRKKGQIHSMSFNNIPIVFDGDIENDTKKPLKLRIIDISGSTMIGEKGEK